MDEGAAEGALAARPGGLGPGGRRDGPAEVCVIGAGLTGAVAALELARAGIGVALVERDPLAMNRASLRNEGKVHLGFVFAKDATFATARLMLDGALSFRGILQQVLGARAGTLALSTPFIYLVARDSLLAPDELETRYAAIEGLYGEKLRACRDGDYLGRRPASLFRRLHLAELEPRIRADDLIGAFQTEELAIDTLELARLVRAAIAEAPTIRFLPRHTVDGVERRAGGFRVTGAGPKGAWSLDADQVINASWENRFRIDRTIGIEHAPGYLHRLKYRVIARLPQRLRDGPSTTMVLGPYGDVVVRPDGTAYFSWYPLGLQGWTHDLAPPESWSAPCRGDLDPATAAATARALLDAIDRWYPGAAEAEPLAIDAGAIVAYGDSDVDDPKSGLHDRTRVGVLSRDGYHSVDPGKLTTAPWFGLRAAERVIAAGAGPALARERSA